MTVSQYVRTYDSIGRVGWFSVDTIVTGLPCGITVTLSFSVTSGAKLSIMFINFAHSST